MGRLRVQVPTSSCSHVYGVGRRAVGAGEVSQVAGDDAGGAAYAGRGLFAADVTAGKVPGIRRIQQQMHVGQPRARLVQAHLRNLTSTTE